MHLPGKILSFLMSTKITATDTTPEKSKNMSAASAKRTRKDRVEMLLQQQNALWRNEEYRAQLQREIKALKEDKEEEYDEETKASIAIMSEMKTAFACLDGVKASCAIVWL